MTNFVNLSEEWWNLYFQDLAAAKTQPKYDFTACESLKQLLATLVSSDGEEKIVKGLINQEFLKGRNNLWYSRLNNADPDIESLKKEKFDVEYRLIDGQFCTVFAAAPWVKGMDHPSKYHGDYHASKFINCLGCAMQPQIGFNVNYARNILYYDSHYHHALSLLTAKLQGNSQSVKNSQQDESTSESSQTKYQLTLYGENDPRDFTIRFDDKNSITFAKKSGERPQGQRGSVPQPIQFSEDPDVQTSLELKTSHIPGCLTNFDIFQYYVKNLIYLEYDGALFLSEFDDVNCPLQTVTVSGPSKEIFDLIKHRKESQVDVSHEEGVDCSGNSKGENVWRELLN